MTNAPDAFADKNTNQWSIDTEMDKKDEQMDDDRYRSQGRPIDTSIDNIRDRASELRHAREEPLVDMHRRASEGGPMSCERSIEFGRVYAQ